METKFGALVELVSEKTPAQSAELDSYVSTENMRVDFGGIDRASSLPTSGNVTAYQAGDVLFSNIRTYFKKVWQSDRPGTCSNDVLVFRPKDKEKLTPGYLFQICRWERFTEMTIRTSKGAKMPRGDKESIKKFKLRLPPLAEQNALTDILGAFDDKIEQNRRTNETLEAMARAIFKDWFIDFGPTRAKMEGRDPYLPPEIWNLFPNTLDGKGNPEGWEPQPLKDFFEIIGGGTPKTSVAQYWHGDIPWFSVVDTPPKGDVFVVETEKNITELGLKESSARLVPEGTTIISARGTVGNLAMAASDMTFNQSCYALKHTADTNSAFVYLGAQHMVEQLQSMAHGSVFSTITRKTFESIHLAMPPRNIMDAFEQGATPLFQRILSNVRESLSLSRTRDMLLPKLISGRSTHTKLNISWRTPNDRSGY